jgi:hypothetical protein
MIRLVFFIFMCFLILKASEVNAVAEKGVFAKYPNRYFIETGSYLGEGLQMALDSNCFEYIYSIELSPYYSELCQIRFLASSNVLVLQGDSAQTLPHLLLHIDAPATFWLDGHYSSGDTARGSTNTPILEELECIRQHSIKTHTLLIDDVRQFASAEFDFIELKTIIEKIYEINREYVIGFENGFVDNDILVAKIN